MRASPGSIERQRRGFALLVRHVGGSLRLPAAFRQRNLLATVPRRMARRLAPRMRELHRDRGLRVFADRRDNGPQRRLGAIVPQTEAPRRDAADVLHRGGFDAQQACARQREIGEMHHVPVGRGAVVGDVLAHRRYHDAVGELNAAQFDRRKQYAHEVFRWEGSRASIMKHRALLNRARPPASFHQRKLQQQRALDHREIVV